MRAPGSETTAVVVALPAPSAQPVDETGGKVKAPRRRKSRKSTSLNGNGRLSGRKDATAFSAAPMGAPQPDERSGDGGGVEKDASAGGRRRKRRRRSTNKEAGAAAAVAVDEKTRLSRRVKSMVNRIRQEQNLLDAYAGEGWKGNAREKIRPEKELERAEAQILSCKLAIRDLFHDLDKLALEGSLRKDAFDDDGQIFHDDIFCAKCKSQETFTDNDIILCDGACDRGFHQKCIDPPLATADIPPGDEGWLCPVCESKAECLNYMNDFLGTDYQVEDRWEKIFASAAEASERAANPGLGGDWPSEDSDDDDYDPERKPAVRDDNVGQENGGESTLGRADSERNSLDGSGSEPEASSGSGSGYGSGSESGSDDNGDESGSSGCSGDELEPSVPERRSRRGDRSVGNGPDVAVLELPPDIPTAVAVAEAEEVVTVSGKRQRNPVDYKMLHNEMFGADDVDMSEDEEWGPGGRPGRRRGKPAEGANGVARRASARPAAVIDNPQGAAPSISPAVQLADEWQDHSDRQQSENARARRIPVPAAKALREEFESGTLLPSRARKENLAQRLGISLKQVTAWFKTARRLNKYGTPRNRNRKGAVAAANGNKIGREGVDEIEITNGLLVEKLDEVQLKLHYLKHTLEAMVANGDVGSQPNGKHIVYVPVAEVVEKDVEIAVENETV